MLAFQAFANTVVFGLIALPFLLIGPFSEGFLICGALSVMFVASRLLIPKFGRLPLVGTWAISFWLVAPHISDGGMMSYLAVFYLVAGFVGACFLPMRDLPPVPGAPADKDGTRARRLRGSP